MCTSAVALAGCGGGKPAGGHRGSHPSSGRASGLAFSRCMRAHGVPRFPDPNAAGGVFDVEVSGEHSSVSIGNGPGVNTESPAFRAANAACGKLLPGGESTAGLQHPSSETITQARTAAECMRTHGVPSFPDPGTVMPANAPTVGHIDNINGAVFVIPGSINLAAPAVQRAARICQFPGGLWSARSLAQSDQARRPHDD